MALSGGWTGLILASGCLLVLTSAITSQKHNLRRHLHKLHDVIPEERLVRVKRNMGDVLTKRDAPEPELHRTKRIVGNDQELGRHKRFRRTVLEAALNRVKRRGSNPESQQEPALIRVKRSEVPPEVELKRYKRDKRSLDHRIAEPELERHKRVKRNAQTLKKAVAQEKKKKRTNASLDKPAKNHNQRKFNAVAMEKRVLRAKKQHKNLREMVKHAERRDHVMKKSHQSGPASHAHAHAHGNRKKKSAADQSVNMEKLKRELDRFKRLRRNIAKNMRAVKLLEISADDKKVRDKKSFVRKN